MLNDFISYYFWFIPPGSLLTLSDKVLFGIFLGLVALALIARISMIFVKNQVNRKLLKKLWYWSLTIGLIGLVWAAIRYENTPLFGRRIWAGIDLLVGLIWLGFIIKYAIFNFRFEKNEFARELIKNKYLPKSR
jgi:hypothetical protein